MCQRFLALFVPEAASLRPCEGRASFRVTELNSTAFGGEVRVARWQPGRKIEIEWGAASDVRLRWYETSSAKLLSCTPHVEVAVFDLGRTRASACPASVVLHEGYYDAALCEDRV